MPDWTASIPSVSELASRNLGLQRPQGQIGRFTSPWGWNIAQGRRRVLAMGGGGGQDATPQSLTNQPDVGNIPQMPSTFSPSTPMISSAPSPQQIAINNSPLLRESIARGQAATSPANLPALPTQSEPSWLGPLRNLQQTQEAREQGRQQALTAMNAPPDINVSFPSRSDYTSAPSPEIGALQQRIAERLAQPAPAMSPQEQARQDFAKKGWKGKLLGALQGFGLGLASGNPLAGVTGAIAGGMGQIFQQRRAQEIAGQRAGEQQQLMDQLRAYGELGTDEYRRASLAQQAYQGDVQNRIQEGNLNLGAAELKVNQLKAQNASTELQNKARQEFLEAQNKQQQNYLESHQKGLAVPEAAWRATGWQFPIPAVIDQSGETKYQLRTDDYGRTFYFNMTDPTQPAIRTQDLPVRPPQGLGDLGRLLGKEIGAAQVKGYYSERDAAEEAKDNIAAQYKTGTAEKIAKAHGWLLPNGKPDVSRVYNTPDIAEGHRRIVNRFLDSPEYKAYVAGETHRIMQRRLQQPPSLPPPLATQRKQGVR